MKTLAILTTVGSLDEARSMAKALVELKLAACVQISGIESFYAWQGETENEPEFRVLIKSTADRYADVEQAIRELHSYDLPAIYSLALEHVFEPYAEWVAENSRATDR